MIAIPLITRMVIKSINGIINITVITKQTTNDKYIHLINRLKPIMNINPKNREMSTSRYPKYKNIADKAAPIPNRIVPIQPIPKQKMPTNKLINKNLAFPDI